MKLFMFVCVALLCAQAQAITITAVEGASNEVKLNGTSSPIFIAGISGITRCQGETTTVNTCITNPERAACNFKTACPSTLLKITLTGKISGRMALLDLSSYPVYDLGDYKAGTTKTVEIPWSEICFAMTSDRACTVISRSVLKLGINSDSHYYPEESASYIFQVSSIYDNIWDHKNDKMESLSTKQGIKDYTIVAGDKKAFVQNLQTQGLYIGEAARVTGIRAFYAPTTCAKINANATAVNASDDSTLLPLSENQTELTSNVIEDGLQNNVKYAFMLGLQDEAGNIGMFKDLQTQCVEGQHTATPKAL